MRSWISLLLLTGCAGAPSPAPQASLRELYSRPSSQWPAPTLDPGIEHRELGLVEKPAPAAQALLELGELLFFDARLSGTHQLACVSCHDPELGFADGRALSFGKQVRPLARNAPSLLNTALRTHWFWDGRAASLEEQAHLVLSHPQEMHSSPEHVESLLRSSKGYRERFAAAFGAGEPRYTQALAALVAYESSFVSEGSSAFDDFLRGDTQRLDDSAIRGLHLFRTQARCLNCHNGPLLSDDRFHNLGLTYYGRELQDLGRYEVTRDPEDVGRFRTPSLRNVLRTAPYMHNGLFELDGVLNMYNVGMPQIEPKPGQEQDPLFPRKSPHLQRLDLSPAEKADLKAFLESLTERKRRVRAPQLPAVGDA